MPKIAGVIRATRDTYLKKDPHQSTLLGGNQRRLLGAGEELRVKAMSASMTDGHYLVTLDKEVATEDDSQRFNTWYVYAHPTHWEVLEDNRLAPSEAIVPVPSPVPASPMIVVPGRGKVALNAPIQSAAPWFTWAEATRNGTRLPISAEVTAGMELLALKLFPVREKFGPLTITSWYRPPSVNQAVGGARNSWHLRGSAVDLSPLNGSVWDLQKWCLEHWPEGVGSGAHRGFVHLDTQRGYRARWSY